MLTILPQRWARIPGRTIWVSAISPNTFVSNCCSHGLQRNLLDRAALAVAGVVDEHADGALGALHLIHRRAHRCLVGHVERERAAAGVLQVLDRLQPPGVA